MGCPLAYVLHLDCLAGWRNSIDSSQCSSFQTKHAFLVIPLRTFSLSFLSRGAFVCLDHAIVVNRAVRISTVPYDLTGPSLFAPRYAGDHQGATTEAGHETVSQQGPTDRPPGYEPAPPGSQERQRGPTGAAPAPATHTRRRAIYPQWKTSQRSGTRKRKAQFEDIRKRVTSALRPSLEGMMHKGGYVFIAHQTGTRVHGCPLRSPSAPRCHRSEMWTGFCWFESR